MFAPLQIGLDQLGSIASIDTIALKDLALGFFSALALKRGRITAILDKVIPSEEADTRQRQAAPVSGRNTAAITTDDTARQPVKRPQQRSEPPADDTPDEKPPKAGATDTEESAPEKTDPTR